MPAHELKGARLPAHELKGARFPAQELKGALLLRCGICPGRGGSESSAPSRDCRVW